MYKSVEEVFDISLKKMELFSNKVGPSAVLTHLIAVTSSVENY